MAEFDISRAGDTLSVVLTGNLTTAMIPELKIQLLKCLESPTAQMIVDLSYTNIVDSSGIGLLIAAYNSITAKNGTIKVINVNEEIMRLLTSMRLDQRLNANRRDQMETAS